MSVIPGKTIIGGPVSDREGEAWRLRFSKCEYEIKKSKELLGARFIMGVCGEPVTRYPRYESDWIYNFESQTKNWVRDEVLDSQGID